MRLFFDDAGFDGQLPRRIGKRDAGMADVGECLYIAERLSSGDQRIHRIVIPAEARTGTWCPASG